MTGREPKYNNDLFFLCSLVEHIARQTKNHRSVVVNAIGKENLQHIYNLADVYHSENIDKITDEQIEKHHIPVGTFDNVAASKYSAPTIWDIGKVYKHLILDIAKYRDTQQFIDILIEVYSSWMSRKLEDFNSSMYYEKSCVYFSVVFGGGCVGMKNEMGKYVILESKLTSENI